MTTQLNVSGMTCDNCVRHVGEALAELPGVTKVQIDLESGIATIDSETALDPAATGAALEEAGYALA